MFLPSIFRGHSQPAEATALFLFASLLSSTCHNMHQKVIRRWQITFQPTFTSNRVFNNVEPCFWFLSSKKCDHLIFCSEPTFINGLFKVLETFYHKKLLVDKLSVKWEKFHGKLFLLLVLIMNKFYPIQVKWFVGLPLTYGF